MVLFRAVDNVNRAVVHPIFQAALMGPAFQAQVAIADAALEELQAVKEAWEGAQAERDALVEICSQLDEVVVCSSAVVTTDASAVVPSVVCFETFLGLQCAQLAILRKFRDVEVCLANAMGDTLVGTLPFVRVFGKKLLRDEVAKFHHAIARLAKFWISYFEAVFRLMSTDKEYQFVKQHVMSFMPHLVDSAILFEAGKKWRIACRHSA